MAVRDCNNSTSYAESKASFPEFQITSGKGVLYVVKLGTSPAPAGWKWVFCRYRKVRGKSGRLLDAHEYGYEAWAFLVPC